LVSARLDRLRRTFAALLQDLSATWPAPDIAFVHEETEHGVYGDALENLIAIGLENGHGFSGEQFRQIDEMAAMMSMANSPFLVRLRDQRAGNPAA
jgi:hypothetical protein